MSTEQRRAMIVAAALPLVAEYGTAVTTNQIARAAGIGEATIFRAFADKEELPGACMAEAVRPDHAIREIASTSRWTRAWSRPRMRWVRTRPAWARSRDLPGPLPTVRGHVTRLRA